MNPVAARMLETARAMLAKNGRTVSYVSVTVGDYDPATSANTVTKSSSSVMAMAKTVHQHDPVLGEVDQVTLSILGTAIKPKRGDRVIVAGVEYAITELASDVVGDITILHHLKGKKT